MKKAVLTLVVALSALTTQAQEFQVSSEKTHWVRETTHQEYIEVKTKGESTYVVFQNRKYSSITDLGIILCPSKDELITMFETCKKIVNTVLSEGENINFKQDYYTIMKYDFNNDGIYIEDLDGNYQALNKREIDEILSSLKS